MKRFAALTLILFLGINHSAAPVIAHAGSGSQTFEEEIPEGEGAFYNIPDFEGLSDESRGEEELAGPGSIAPKPSVPESLLPGFTGPEAAKSEPEHAEAGAEIENETKSGTENNQTEGGQVEKGPTPGQTETETSPLPETAEEAPPEEGILEAAAASISLSGRGHYIIDSDGTYSISGSHAGTEESFVVIAGGISAVLILDDAEISAAGSAITLESGAELTLILSGDSKLETAWTSGLATVNAPEGTKLVITEAETGGSLEVKGSAAGAAIGGNDGESAGTVEIKSGAITVNENIRSTNSDRLLSAGIGGGNGGSGGDILISGGDVAVFIPTWGRGAGIGSGSACDGGDGKLTGIVITDGSITVEAGDNSSGAGIGLGQAADNLKTVIRGGTVYSEGWQGAGIGGGAFSDNIFVQISGGNIEGAHGGPRQFVDSTGAGIGTGYNGGSADIRISGGQITGWGGSGSAGIGTGSIDGKGTGAADQTLEITIAGGNVWADSGRDAAGIGSGKVNDWAMTQNVAIRITGRDTVVEGYGRQQRRGTPQLEGGITSVGIGAGSFINNSLAYDTPLFHGSLLIDIQEADVTAVSANGVAIGPGWITTDSNLSGTGYVAEVDTVIRIGNRAEVSATGGKARCAAIGTDYMSTKADLHTEIIIEDATVVAVGGAYTDYGCEGGPAIGIVGGTGNLEIYRSDITATAAGNFTAAIGTGFQSNYAGTTETMSILLRDSDIEARGMQYAPAIGSGRNSKEVEVIIDGGTVNAYGGPVGPGIGAGHNSAAVSITILDGSVYAEGGSGAPGIGNNYLDHVGTNGTGNQEEGSITIKGGAVTAIGADGGSGIGSSWGEAIPQIFITGGSVYAQGGRGGAGIGSPIEGLSRSITSRGIPETMDEADIRITGGTVAAVGGAGAAAIGTGYQSENGMRLLLTGGEITAIGGRLFDSEEDSAYAIGAGAENSGTTRMVFIEKEAGIRAYRQSPGQSIESGDYSRGTGQVVNAYVEDESFQDLCHVCNGEIEVTVNNDQGSFSLEVPEHYQSFAYTVENPLPNLHYTLVEESLTLLAHGDYGQADAQGNLISDIPAHLIPRPMLNMLAEPVKLSDELIAAVTYSLDYDGNGQTAGTVEYDSSIRYESGSWATAAEKGTLEKEGFTFTHWCTSRDGSGKKLLPGERLEMQADTVLYAQWTANGDGGGNGNGGGGDGNGDGGGGGGTKPPEPPVTPGGGSSGKGNAQADTEEEEAPAETFFHKAYVVGYPDGSFRAEHDVTRAEAMTMLYKLSETVSAGRAGIGSQFSDLEENPWYLEAVLHGEEKGIIVGYEGCFRPYDGITRAEMAAVISKTAAAEGLIHEGTTAVEFSDVDSSHWAVAYIREAAAKGWIVGYEDGSFKPDSSITRAEAVTMINAIYNRQADEEFLVKGALYTDLKESHWGFWQIVEASQEHWFSKLEDGGESWAAE